MKIENYVLGFYWNQYGVMLIHKSEGRFNGLCNGIGGKIEEGEEPVEAMVREFYEETGILTNPNEWQYNAFLSGNRFTMQVYSIRGGLTYHKHTTKEGRVQFYNELPPNIQSTARWLFHMICDFSNTGTSFSGTIPPMASADLYPIPQDNQNRKIVNFGSTMIDIERLKDHVLGTEPPLMDSFRD